GGSPGALRFAPANSEIWASIFQGLGSPFPATAPTISIRPRANLRDRVSKTQFARGSTEAACQFMGPWLKSEAPALQAVLSGSVTRRTPPISTVLRGTRLKHRAKSHKLRQAGVIPA